MATQVMQPSASLEESEQSSETVLAHEEIASLAYALWKQRGSPEDSPDEDWFRAEQEMKKSSVVPSLRHPAAATPPRSQVRQLEREPRLKDDSEFGRVEAIVASGHRQG